MKINICTLLVVLSAPILAKEAVSQDFAGKRPIEWSQSLAKSEMTRRGKSLYKDGSPKARWDYTSGLFAHSLVELGNATGDPEMNRYAVDLVGSYIGADGSIATYQIEDYNIDMVTPGRVAIAAYEASNDARFKKAAEIVRGQLSKQPRTSDGGFWHKQRYPWQMWLDGLYMGSPFLASYGKAFQEPDAFDEVARQIILMDQHSYDAKSGLHFHAWDEKREQSWANRKTGTSPCFWGRSIGWYAMAIVDSLDYLPANHKGVEPAREILRRLASGVIRYQDPASGRWWQVVDQGGREGNYLETSATSMYVYALAKGVNRGHLDRNTYLPAITKGYLGLVRDCLREDDSKQLHLKYNCEVAGLGYTSSSGRPRDGTFEYYISEPVIENDLKGVGPFILAGIEVQNLVEAGSADATVATDGSGDFLTIQEAISKAPVATSEKPWTIRIKKGIYKELVQIQREKRFVRLIGEDMESTVVSYGLHATMKGLDGKEIGTFRTPTVLIDADDFTVENLTLENSAGAVGQALALRVDGDRVSFRNCTFRGYQDTILLNRGRQHFKDCKIIGAVDYIFGGATAFFDNCTLECVGNGYITAASTPQETPYGFVFSRCTIRITDPKFKVYLGRPWRPFASTIFIHSKMPAGIRPEGWHNWDKPEREATARFSEFRCTGPGAASQQRVKWVQPLTEADAATMDASRILDGWTP